MIEYNDLYSALSQTKAKTWVNTLQDQVAKAFDSGRHGRLDEWRAHLDQLPRTQPSSNILDSDAVTIGQADDLTETQSEALEHHLRALIPWRKGPFNLFGLQIDCEWRSDWKWERLKNHIAPLNNRWVMDVGCGNGYHCWRMLGSGARLVIGIDPLLLNVMQFLAIKQLYGAAPVFVLPLAIEELQERLQLFDTVFSMGVLYHRRSPIDHLLELKQLLKCGGELVLETLIIDGRDGHVLVPEHRYANMRNVWFIPSIDSLCTWLKRCGFVNIRVIDITPTSIQEQRTTDWMPFLSLTDFLDSENHQLTAEGLPAPKRAILLANLQ